MKKTFALSLAALLCVSLLAGCGGTAEAPAEETEEARRKKQDYIAVVDINPYSFT